MAGIRTKQYMRIAAAANSNTSRIEKDRYLCLRRAATIIMGKYVNAIDIMLHVNVFDIMLTVIVRQLIKFNQQSR